MFSMVSGIWEVFRHQKLEGTGGSRLSVSPWKNFMTWGMGTEDEGE